MNAAEIKQRLIERAESVCAHLLPNGKRKGRQWVVGNIQGDAGDSLRIELDGDRAGLWIDFGGRESQGDILSLWMEARQIPFTQTLDEAMDWLGVKGQGRILSASERRDFLAPKLQGIKKANEGSPVIEYLTKERGISLEAIHKLKIAQHIHPEIGPEIVFPYYTPDGATVDHVKYLAVARKDGKKQIRTSAKTKPHLFGWNAIGPNEREVVVCEGEGDCATLVTFGIPALSVPFGAKEHDAWMESDYHALDRFERIYLCFDNDEVGREGLEKLAERLGRERCFEMKLPDEFKDINEAALVGKFCGEDFVECMTKAATLDPTELRRSGEYYDRVVEGFWPTDMRMTGTETPFPWDVRIRPEEISIWTGFSGHGKSLLINQFLLHDANQGEKVCIASFEIAVHKTLMILSQMALGDRPAKREDVKRAVDWLDGKFWFFDHRGPKHWKKFLPTLEYAAKRYGCSRFVIDSLLLCGIGSEDYVVQKEFVAELCGFAAKHKVHIHLVAHSKKKEDESKAPGKLDVKGSGDITDLCHNGYTVWRNKRKERELLIAHESGLHHSHVSKLMEEPDGQIQMWKNRETGDEPYTNLWIHKRSMQFSNSNLLSHETYIPQNQ